jgi:hypothetical protein
MNNARVKDLSLKILIRYLISGPISEIFQERLIWSSVAHNEAVLKNIFHLYLFYYAISNPDMNTFLKCRSFCACGLKASATPTMTR